LFLGANEVVLVRVDDNLVGHDSFDRPSRLTTQLVWTEPGGLLHEMGFDHLTLLIGDSNRQLPRGLNDHRRMSG
jgi:hypothetical protein